MTIYGPKSFKVEMEHIERMILGEERHQASEQLMAKVLKQYGYADGIAVFERMDDNNRRGSQAERSARHHRHRRA